MSWYIKVLKNYAVFSGRASRREFWTFAFCHGVIVVGGILFGVYTNVLVLALMGAYLCATLLPSIAVGVRRMHDTNHSGWWYFMAAGALIFALRTGDEGTNRFGANPKSELAPNPLLALA
jgi:uncharacterized membrane protein YhaH (DUF805 family)